ncbi:hypothetical protein BM524_02430 [Alteromonas mediterranea]|uniref:Uncharacterized protein n=1 Tax=Alteromonas mediterranea TaxID=314275 RepID=A0AAC9NQL3_9ALTE|nr:hypothetical protein [Alteromonas mediterranea]APD88756.1 hypothetical protein BM524_02430 [Alteromonas mediterranea]
MLTAFIGGITGYVFGNNEQLKFYKLLNLFGLLYDFIAVILLSYVILVKTNIQNTVAHYLSLSFVTFTTMFPASFHMSFSLSSGKSQLESSIYAFILISIAPAIYVYTSPVLEPLSFKSYSPSTRIKILGTLLLLVGFAFQIVAAVSDLGS